MVGLFINTLPARVRVAPAAPLIPWLRELQTEQVKREQYSYSSLTDIHRGIGFPAGESLFESIVIFDNYPVQESLRDGVEGLRVSEVAFTESTSYPLTVVASPGADLFLKMLFDRGRFDEAAIQQLLQHLTSLLRSMAGNPERLLSEFDSLSTREGDSLAAAFNEDLEREGNP